MLVKHKEVIVRQENVILCVARWVLICCLLLGDSQFWLEILINRYLLAQFNTETPWPQMHIASWSTIHPTPSIACFQEKATRYQTLTYLSITCTATRYMLLRSITWDDWFEVLIINIIHQSGDANINQKIKN
jgi:hypothetical protein